MNERKKLFCLILSLSILALIASAAAIYLLYATALQSTRDQLTATVRSQARLIEAMARFDARRDPHARSPELPAAVLDAILDSFSRYKGVGETGEFLVGRREGDAMVFLARQRVDGPAPHHPESIPIHDVLGEPMRRALSGESGVMIGRDYRGEKVLAAYEAVRGWNLGVVAKIDLAEIRAPFMRAGALAGGLAISVVLLCATLVLRFTHPIIRRLRESELRTRTIVDAAADGIITIDEKGVVESFNAGAERMFGYARDEIIGRNISLLMPEPYHSEHDTYLRNYLHTGRPKVIGVGCRAQARRKDGSVFPMDLTVNEMLLDGRRKFVGIIHDTTERRRIEDSLRESEARLNEAQRIAHIGSWDLDLTHDHLAWSEEIFRIFEIDPQRFGASYEAFLGAVHPDDREAVNRAYAESVKNRTPYEITHRLRMPDGRIKYVHERCVNYYGEQGTPLRSVGTVQDVTERVLTEQARRQSEERLRIIYDASPAVISVSRLEDGRFLDVNPAFLRTGGWTREEVISRTSFDLGVWVDAGDRAKIVKSVREMGAIRDLELSFRMKSGEQRRLLCSVERIRIEDVDCLLLVGQDITERKKAETLMQKLSRALEQTADAVQITDRNGVIEYVNPTFEQVTGYTSAEAVGRKTNLLKSGRQGPGFYDNLWKTILAGEVFNDVFINRRKDGSLYYEEKTITPLKDADGQIAHFVATGKDITERMQTQERLAYMAQHDPLTELPNRTLLLDRLKQSLAGARWRNRRTAVLFVDLDRFKTINDTLGHEVGDRLLQQLAARFQASVREGDTVARFGGDEFVILLDDVASEDDVAGVAQKVLQALTPPFQVDHQTLYVTASIGVSLFPNDGEDATALLKNADIAMYRAKEMGKNTYQFYSADMSARAFERLTLESSLRRALDRNEFRLYYQPQVDVETGVIIGVEALLRWQHPEFGLVMPSDFIPLLEETGLIVPAGEWVLRTACAQLAAWHAQGWRRLRLSVNLSPRQLQAQDLTAVVKRALDSFDGDPARLELEITEGVLVRHAPATVEALEALDALGVRMAVDDFGTGYSSLSYLRRLPIDTLKIDRVFVRDIPLDPDDSAITAAIVALAQSLKLEMIAEGVENAAQRDFLLGQGCRVMQGYLFSRPQPPEDVTRLLQAPKLR